MARVGFKRGLIALTVVGFLIRFGCLELASPVRITGDEVYFSKVAINIASGNGHTNDDGSKASWPPGNPFFMSWFVDPGRSEDGAAGLVHTIKMMMVGQVILGTLLVPLVMLLALVLFDRRTATVAGVITALYPAFVAYGHYLWAENAFLVPAVAGLIVAVYARRGSDADEAAGCACGGRAAPRASFAPGAHPISATGYILPIVSGIFFGIAALSRETGLVIAGACGLWFAWTSSGPRRSGAVLRAVLLVLVAVLAVVPWTIRNHRVTGGFIPIATISWMAMAEGNIFGPDDWLHPDRDVLAEFRTEWRAIEDEVQRMEFSRRVALEHIRKEQPSWILKKFVRTSGLLFGPDSFLFKKISRGAYGDLSMSTIRLLLVLSVSSYVFVALAGLAGIALAPDRTHRLLALLVAGSVFVLHVAAFTSSRHRLPIVALLIPYAAYAITRRREIPRLMKKCLTGRQWVIPAIILIWFFTLCVPYFAGDARSLWSKGTYVKPWRP